MNVGSLFAGIGGFDLGLERAGFRTAWFCEQDEFCQRVLAKHWPGVPCYGDIREFRGTDVEPVDVLCGGFPCQDISIAGKGAGLAGARSGLWSEYARLIGELRPRYVIVENVSALLARGVGRVLGDLAALGYDAEWDCIPASAVGAPHRRDRIWIVAYPGGEQHESASDAQRWPTAPGFLEADPYADRGRQQERRERDGDTPQPELEASQRRDLDGLRANVADTDEERRSGRPGQLRSVWRHEPADSGQRVQDADSSSLQSWRVGGRAAQSGGSEWWAVEPPVGRVAHGVPNRLDQLAALGNALVPQIAEWIGHRIMSYERGLA